MRLAVVAEQVFGQRVGTAGELGPGALRKETLLQAVAGKDEFVTVDQVRFLQHGCAIVLAEDAVTADKVLVR